MLKRTSVIWQGRANAYGLVYPTFRFGLNTLLERCILLHLHLQIKIQLWCPAPFIQLEQFDNVLICVGFMQLIITECLVNMQENARSPPRILMVTLYLIKLLHMQRSMNSTLAVLCCFCFFVVAIAFVVVFAVVVAKITLIS